MEKTMNAVRLVGAIGRINDDEVKAIELITKAMSRGDQLETSHAIVVDEIPDWAKEGQKMEVVGQFEMIGKRTVIKALDLVKKPKNAEFMNVARIQGPLARPAEYFPPKPGKRAFGNLLVKLENLFSRIVVFNKTALDMDGVSAGAHVAAEGRVQYRDFNDGKFTEIAASEATVLVDVKPVDAFAGTRFAKPVEETKADEGKPAATNDPIAAGIPF